MAGRAEPSRGLAGAGPGSRGRRRPGPPPAPPTLAQRAAAASPLRMSRKGPRAEVCADCSAPGKRGRAGGGTVHRGAAGRAPGPGGRAVRGRRAGRGWGLRPPASGLGPRPGRCGAASLEGGPLGGPRFARVRGPARKDIPGAASRPSAGAPTLPRSPRLPSLDPNGSASLGWPGVLAEAGRASEVGASVVLCHLRATPASCTCCSRGLRARKGGGGQGAESGQMGRGGVGGCLDSVFSGADGGVASPRTPCPWLPRLLAGPGVQGHHRLGHRPLRCPQAW